MKTKEARLVWETCCAEPHADEVAMLRNHLEAAWTRISQLENQASIARGHEGRREKDIRAAAKRAAWNDVLFNMRIYVWADAKRWIYDLVNAFGQEVPTAKKALEERLERLRWNIMMVKKTADELDNPEAVPLVAELLRMREAVNAAGAKLHAEYGISNGERCGCPGCEMTRGVYDSTLPEVGASS